MKKRNINAPTAEKNNSVYMSDFPIISRDSLSPSERQLLDQIRFTIIGVQKGGTTWLSDILSTHEEIHIPERKELHFYNQRPHYSQGVEWYLDNFKDHNGQTVWGEATPNYMWNVATPEEYAKEGDGLLFDVAPRMRALTPEAKLIICLRDPIERAISSYYHQVTRGRLSPLKTLRDQMHTHGILSMSHYDQHLETWFEHFPQEQFHVVVFEEDIRPDENKLATVDAVCDFIGIQRLGDKPVLYELSNEKHDPLLAYLRQVPFVSFAKVTDEDRDPLADRVARALSRRAPDWIQRMVEIKITDEDRDALREALQPDHDRLEAMLGRKLPW